MFQALPLCTHYGDIRVPPTHAAIRCEHAASQARTETSALRAGVHLSLRVPRTHIPSSCGLPWRSQARAQSLTYTVYLTFALPLKTHKGDS